MSEKSTTNNGSQAACPECGNERLIKDHHQNTVVCTQCGYVVREGLPDLTPEWRDYPDQEGDPSRVGPPVSVMIHDKGLSTKVPRTYRDARGNSISPEKMKRLHRMRKMDRWSKLSGPNRSLNRVSSLISIASSQLSLPRPVCRRAMTIYKNAMNAGLVKGRRLEDVLAASIYAACRECDATRPIGEIARTLGARKDDVKHARTLLERNLKLELPITNLTHYVAEFARDLSVCSNLRRKALELAEKLMRDNCTHGKKPQSVAAAIIDIVSQDSGEGLAESEIERISCTSRATIEDVSREITRKLGGELRE